MKNGARDDGEVHDGKKDGWTEGLTDGRTDRQKERKKDGRTDVRRPLSSHGYSTLPQRHHCEIQSSARKAEFCRQMDCYI
jgi:hypothetical protein